MKDLLCETRRHQECAESAYERIQREYPSARVKGQALIKKRLNGAESAGGRQRFMWCDLLIFELPDGREESIVVELGKVFEAGEDSVDDSNIPAFLRRSE